MSDTPDPAENARPDVAWHTLEGDAVIADLSSDGVNGLTIEAAAAVFAEVGPNQLQDETMIPNRRTIA